ncbi:hypothetical protein AC579_5269, partial [Pseudocercospora musae]
MEHFKRRPGACNGGLPQCQRCELMQQKCTYLPSKKRGRRPKCSQPSTIDGTRSSDGCWQVPTTPFTPPDPLIPQPATSPYAVSEVTWSRLPSESEYDDDAIDLQPWNHAIDIGTPDLCYDIAGQDWTSYLTTPSR